MAPSPRTPVNVALNSWDRLVVSAIREIGRPKAFPSVVSFSPPPLWILWLPLMLLPNRSSSPHHLPIPRLAGVCCLMFEHNWLWQTDNGGVSLVIYFLRWIPHSLDWSFTHFIRFPYRIDRQIDGKHNYNHRCFASVILLDLSCRNPFALHPQRELDEK